MASFVKDPTAILDYEFDWTPWLAATETITAATVTPDPGLTVTNTITGAGTVTVWLSGGTDGAYQVHCHVTTSAGRQDQRSFTVRVIDR